MIYQNVYINISCFKCMAKDRWTVKGHIKLKHNNQTISKNYPDIVPLKDLKVKVYAREKIAGIWGPYKSWGSTYTDKDGFFKITKDKDKSNRQFKIKVLFKDDELKIYPDNEGFINNIIEKLSATFGIKGVITEEIAELLMEQTSRLAYDVKWYTIYKEDKHDKDHKRGVVNLGDLVFGNGSEDLRNSIAEAHALIWFIYKEVFNYIDKLEGKVGFNKKKTIAIKYPHSLKVIEKKENSYANPLNNVIFIIKNRYRDDLDIDTLIHELCHILTYQNSKGEDSMAWQLLIHGSTHDNVKKSFVAFYEGIAEKFSNIIIKDIFGEDSEIYGGVIDNGKPFSRSFLSGVGVTKLADVDKSEYAWISLINMLMIDKLAGYDFNTSGTYAAYTSMPKKRCTNPSLSFADILSIFQPKASAGYTKILHKNEMNLDDFLERVDAYFKLDIKDAFKQILDPKSNKNPSELLCEELKIKRDKATIDKSIKRRIRR